MTTQISIIGCGWLGFPLAKALIKKGLRVKGSTTSRVKLEMLTDAQIEGFHLVISPQKIEGNLKECLRNSDVLILNIPPKLRNDPKLDYVAIIENLIPYVEAAKVKKLIFVGSTSVFADEASMPEITESTIPNPITESGRQLLRAEQVLQNNANFKTTIVRFAGLFGEGRHPAKSLSGKSNLKNPKAPVNLIHLKDCIQIIAAIIEQDSFGETYHAATTPHPLKQEYYSAICKAMGLALPAYDLAQKSKGKTIHSTKVKTSFNYQFEVELQ